jgi:hypothetical protein
LPQHPELLPPIAALLDSVELRRADTAPACAPCTTPAWLARQQARREGEPSATPVRDGERYLRARREQLDYAGALAAGLPMGSGLLESGRRHVVQAG